MVAIQQPKWCPERGNRMTQLQEKLQGYFDINLRQVIISGPKKEEAVSKIRIRPVLMREQLFFQCTKTVGAKQLHSNHSKEEILEMIGGWMEEEFKQLQLESDMGELSVLVSKKGKMTIKEKKKMMHAAASAVGEERRMQLEHNRKKRYILQEGHPVKFLQDLGVMTSEGKVVRARYDKFRQINRFLEFVEDVLPRLPRSREVTILDFGCGKSYLTFAMYYYLHELQQYDVRIIGLDLKEDVIAHCSRLSEAYGYDKLKFYKGDIASYEGVTQVDMVVTLHACDTATDYALAKAVKWGASVILSVPCCQHEFNKQMENELLSGVFSYGIIKERMAALMTDAMRAQMLEAMGYETQILEFIDMEHTPKNLLIRAVYTGHRKESNEKWKECLEAFHVEPTLEKLLFQEGERV